MHVAVLGAGIAGITTAYYLSQAGHEVTVFEQHDTVASGTSFANAGQLAYSYVDAMASPNFAGQLPRILSGLDPSSQFKARAGFAFAGWGLNFLRQCTNDRARKNTLGLLDMALRSSANLQALRHNVPIDFDFRASSKLVMLRSADEVADARRTAALKKEHGCETEVISLASAKTLEPALEAMQPGYTAAIYAQGDHVGDAAKFARNLATWLERDGSVKLRMAEAVREIRVQQRNVVELITARDQVAVSTVVVCLGAWSDALLRPHGIRTGICPIRGYSLTLPPGEHTPTLSVTDPQRRVVFTRLGDAVRIAGFADFLGFDAGNDEARTNQLLETAKSTAPQAADYAASCQNRWGGFRPMTVDGRPCVGATQVGGLYVNTGHGALGWTLACATAEDVAQLIGNTQAKE